MPVTPEELMAAYHQRRPQQPGILQNLFDALMPDPRQGLPTPPLMPGSLGSVGPYGMPIRERLSALMESPNYLGTPLRQRLAMLRGQPSGEVSSSIGRSTTRLRDLIGKAKATEAPLRRSPLGQAAEEGRRVGSIPRPFPEWLQQLLKGGKQ